MVIGTRFTEYTLCTFSFNEMATGLLLSLSLASEASRVVITSTSCNVDGNFFTWKQCKEMSFGTELKEIVVSDVTLSPEELDDFFGSVSKASPPLFDFH